MICSFCKYYQKSSLREKNGTGNLRYCSAKDKMVMEGAEGCSKFVLTSTFWCSKSNYFIDPKICMNRRVKEVSECKKCKQGKILETYLKRRRKRNDSEK